MNTKMATGGGRPPAVSSIITVVAAVAMIAGGGLSEAAALPTGLKPVAPPPRKELAEFMVRMVNRMEGKMEFDCHQWPGRFELEAHGGDYNVTYETTIERPEYSVRNPRVDCIWSYEGNFMSDMVIWDEKDWPEKNACRVATGGGGGGHCELLFENKEMVLVTPAGRNVLGDLAVKECSTQWYGRLLPWGVGCRYPKHAHAYAGNVRSTWTSAALNSIIGH
ncbi:hypothetical protein ABZP36_026577 [Zizania latifolia]